MVIEKIILVNDQIWCSVVDSIQVFNLKFEFEKVIKLVEVKKYVGLAQCDRSSVIVAGPDNSGLHEISDKGE